MIAISEYDVNNIEKETSLIDSLRKDGWNYIGQSKDLVIMEREKELKIIHRNWRILE